MENNIKKTRKNKGFTQAEFAKKIGVSIPTLSGYENSICYPKIDTVQKMMNELNCSVFELFCLKIN